MMKATRRLGRLSGVIAAGVAIVGTGSCVMAASYSAFSSPTTNAGNQWTTGSVTLNNDTSAALFTGTAQAANAAATKCIKVISSGNLPSTIKLYSTAFSDTNSLGSHINLTISVGTALSLGGAADCTGFIPVPGVPLYSGTLAAFNSGHNGGYSSGITTGFNPLGGVTGTEARVFQFTWSYDSTAPQNSTATDAFTWEAQSS